MRTALLIAFIVEMVMVVTTMLLYVVSVVKDLKMQYLLQYIVLGLNFIVMITSLLNLLLRISG